MWRRQKEKLIDDEAGGNGRRDKGGEDRDMDVEMEEAQATHGDEERKSRDKERNGTEGGSGTTKGMEVDLATNVETGKGGGSKLQAEAGKTRKDKKAGGGKERKRRVTKTERATKNFRKNEGACE